MDLEQDVHQIEQGRGSRRTFLRRLGAFVAVGLGAGVVPAIARAQNGTCCRGGCSIQCAGGQLAYFCNGCGLQCCACYLPFQECYNVPCPCG